MAEIISFGVRSKFMYLFGNLKNLFSKTGLFVLGLFILSLTTDSFAAKGNLDRPFGDFGKVISPVGGAEKAMDAIVQPNGKIVVVGGATGANSTFDFLVQRYNADGSLDPDFGNLGKATLAISPRSEVAHAVVLQPDGKIVVAGYIQQASGYADYCLVRLLPDGQLDTAFGETGVKVLSITATSDIPTALAIQTLNGVDRIIVGGYVNTAPAQFSVSRLDLTGQLDTTFGDGGTKSVSIGGVTDTLQDIVIDDEAKITAVGFSRFDFGGGSYRDDFAAVRFYSGGQLDPTFSGDGKVVTPMAGHAQARSVAIQKVGTAEKIVLGGFARNGATFDDFALLRYNYDGTVDPTFGTNGKTYTNFAQNDDQINELLVQPGGRIVAVGLMNAGINRNFALARYNLDGSLDKTFGACGTVVTDLGTNIDIAYGAALHPGGKIIAVGETTNAATGADFAVVRYTTGGQATATNADFDGDGKEEVSVYRPSEGVWYANCACQGFRAVRFGLPGDIPVAGDYDGDGRTDQAVFRGGTWYLNRSSDGHMGSVDFGLADDIPTVGDYDGDDRADISVWRPSTGVWYVLRSSDLQYTATAFGLAGDKPVPADFDGDGKTDLAIYRNGDWWIKQSSDPSDNLVFRKFGLETDLALAKDFDGDGRADLNIYRPSETNWYQQFTNAVKITRFGISTDKPAPADFDGDGKTDIAVFRNGVWYVLSGSNNSYSVVHFGTTGDLPTVVR
jgi:uncharacterized delta-60 repeat protein